MEGKFDERRSPELSDMDWFGAVMAFGGWPQVPWEEAEARLYAETLTKTPFEHVCAASIDFMERENMRTLVDIGLTRRRFRAGREFPIVEADELSVRKHAERELRGEGEHRTVDAYEWESRPWPCRPFAEEARDMLERRIKAIRAFRGIMPDMKLVAWIRQEISRQKECMRVA